MNYLKKLGFIAAGIALIGAACTSTDSTSSDLVGNWVKSESFDGVGRAGAVCFVINDTAYVATGYDGTNRLKDTWAFHPTKGWSQRSIMPALAAARNSAVGFAANGKGYVTTGYDGYNRLQDTWEFDPLSNSWMQKANLPDQTNGTVGSGARMGAVGFALLNKGYVCAGYTGSHMKDLWQFDPTNGTMGTWTQKTSINTSDKRRDAAVLVYQDKAYIVTGTNNGVVSSEMNMYDPASDSWTKKRDIANVSSENYDDNYSSIVRGSAVAFVLNGKGYVTTGENGSYNKTTWEYDFATDVWTQRTSFERSDRSSAIAFTVANRAFVGLGKNSTYYLDNVDEFKPTAAYSAND